MLQGIIQAFIAQSLTAARTRFSIPPYVLYQASLPRLVNGTGPFTQCPPCSVRQERQQLSQSISAPIMVFMSWIVELSDLALQPDMLVFGCSCAVRGREPRR